MLHNKELDQWLHSLYKGFFWGIKFNTFKKKKKVYLSRNNSKTMTRGLLHTQKSSKKKMNTHFFEWIFKSSFSLFFFLFQSLLFTLFMTFSVTNFFSTTPVISRHVSFAIFYSFAACQLISSSKSSPLKKPWPQGSKAGDWHCRSYKNSQVDCS